MKSGFLRALYFPYWYVQAVIMRKHWPLQTVIFVTNACNLRCKHCTPEGHNGHQMKSYEQIKEELEKCYQMGSRFVDFEGGEPTLWHDGEKTLNDLYNLAKDIGFYSGTLTTNGQRPFEDTLADTIWVSVDGYGKYHDRVRGKGTFKKLDQHIWACEHDALSISMSVNRLNMRSVGKLIRYAWEHPHIQKICFNFHTPFPDTEGLTMSQMEREKVIDLILKYKRQGAPIMNTVSGLKMMRLGGFKKYCWIANYVMIDGSFIEQCPGKILGVCDECGFSMAGEMNALVHLRLDTILAGLSLRMNEKQ